MYRFSDLSCGILLRAGLATALLSTVAAAPSLAQSGGTVETITSDERRTREGLVYVPSSHGTDIHISGSYSYQRTEGRVRIQINQVSNSSSTRTTGTLHARLFATTSSRLEGSRGYWIASASFAQQFIDTGRLPPNSSFSDIDLETNWEGPPPGTYYLFLVISEYPSLDTVLDSGRFSDRLTVEEAGGVEINGSSSYQRTGGRVRIQINQVSNSSSTRTTGTLHARLFATTSSRLEGSRGYWIASASFAQQFTDNGRLPPNSSFNDVDLETDWEAPPPGTYYVFLVISEYPDLDTPLDSGRFSDRLTVEEAGGVEINGSFSYQRTGGRVRIQINQVSNSSSTRTTGTLHARLFATTSSRLEGSRGYWIASASFAQQFTDNGRLPPNSSFNDVDLETDWEAPPPGTYYVFLVISEYPDLDTPLDSGRFSDRLTVEDPTTDSCTSDLGDILGIVTRRASWDGSCPSAHRSGRFARYYTFTLRQRHEITIELTSPTVDTYLYLLRGAGQRGTVIDSNDDMVGSNSRITSMLEPGTYTVEATTYSSGATGPFTLLLQPTVTAPGDLKGGVKDLVDESLEDLQDDSGGREATESVPALPTAGVLLLVTLLGLLGRRRLRAG